MSYTPGPTPGTVRAPDGQVLTPPAQWALCPPGDPALTRRLKAAGDFWAVSEKRGNKVFSRGIWADRDLIATLQAQLEAEREDPA